MSAEACPCGSGQIFGSCCQPYLLGSVSAPTAEALMRSRYTAYHQGDIDYLIATHHPTQRYGGQRAAIVQSVATTRWLSLRVLATEAGQIADRQGVVEFVAYYEDPKPGQVHERSRFVRQKERWFYVDGDALPPLVPKRSDPCWCGSGKKYKACHGR
ncbi:YchJ family protein [Nodosilinea sp. LEGE 06152]|uniref:YchJ family protein n=1 Tax=Nodosilinea sp. LEGE 06152 TaxID=2777966 RepID=UPI00187E4F2A|nr:YchJ family protein [Nodosilinea sp. LEGE 06152]MBE9159068.1 YchJ family protein [Nodosilinea sp. LEGE 06152]